MQKVFIIVVIGIMTTFISCLSSKAQESTYNGQFWNEISFSRPINNNWALEFNIGQTWTSTPDSKRMFARNSQLYGRIWVQYYAGARWKFSFFYAYYYNRYLPEIDQKELPELRAAYQAIYFFHKHRYTLSTRLRIEDRHLKTEEGKFEAYYRFRGQFKLVYPFNDRQIQKGVVYGIGSFECFFKNNSQVAGSNALDRTRFTIGAGYSITNDAQVEVTYANEFLPRDDGNEIYNALQVNIGFANFITNLKKNFLIETGTWKQLTII